jgi:hypothetical protein
VRRLEFSPSQFSAILDGFTAWNRPLFLDPENGIGALESGRRVYRWVRWKRTDVLNVIAQRRLEAVAFPMPKPARQYRRLHLTGIFTPNRRERLDVNRFDVNRFGVFNGR